MAIIKRKGKTLYSIIYPSDKNLIYHLKRAELKWNKKESVEQHDRSNKILMTFHIRMMWQTE